jgi:dynein heavy chain
VEGPKPPAREDMAVCYDPKLCRLFFYGGWANRWMEDLWTLNVSPIIGPPYATLSVSPIIGPVFGDTEITVKGIQFRQSSKIEIRFGDGKTATTVAGEFVDKTTVRCKTPSFETFGAVEVDVKVAISGEGWTVNTVKFQVRQPPAVRDGMHMRLPVEGYH